jgi:hypothetical protein
MYEQGLDQWTRVWHGEAVDAGFIHPHYHPDSVTTKRLRGYFDAGLSPTEAAQACFAYKH